MVHVLNALALHHGERYVAKASTVCRGWYERVAASSQLEQDADNVIGELRSGDKPYRFDRPHGCIFLPNGDICVADCDNFRLQIVSREGHYVREVKLAGGTSCPTGVAAYGEALYVVEHGAHQLSKLRRASSSGHRHATAGGWGGGDGELRHPWAVCVAARRVYVTDQGNDRVSVFDAEKLSWLFSFGGHGKGSGQLHEPRCVPDPLTHRPRRARSRCMAGAITWCPRAAASRATPHPTLSRLPPPVFTLPCRCHRARRRACRDPRPSERTVGVSGRMQRWRQHSRRRRSSRRRRCTSRCFDPDAARRSETLSAMALLLVEGRW